MMRKTALTIAGSDPSGGAGIQADIKTMMANGVYAMSAITALTAQNTLGVTGILEVPADFLGKQLDAVFTDIFPDAVKIGMVSSADTAHCIARVLKQYDVKNIVMDPVMVSSSGTRLMNEETMTVIKEELFPLVTLLTPNIPEAGVLWADIESGENGKYSIQTRSDVECAAAKIGEKYGCAVLIKGGHSVGGADDYLYCGGGINAGIPAVQQWFFGERIDNPNNHGTGCTLSSAIASNLAKGYTLPDAVKAAKRYLSGALGAMLNLGAGSGPMDHGYKFQEE